MAASFGRLLKRWIIAALCVILLGRGVSAALLSPQVGEAVAAVHHPPGGWRGHLDRPGAGAAAFSQNEKRGKVVAPFCTSSYSSIDNSLHIFRELASGAAVAEGLTANDQSTIRPWVDQVMAQLER